MEASCYALRGVRNMRFAIVFLAALFSMAAEAQSDIWKQVNPLYNGPRLQSVTPGDAQLRAIGKLLRQPGKSDMWGCEGNDLDDMIRGLIFEEIPLAQGQRVFLVEAGAGCARGGQGANGAMWLIRFDGEKPVLLASPDNDFNGWLYSIQPTVSHGYHDLVLGWHLGADNYNLSYFRFDGKAYVAIGRANDNLGEITPDK